MMDELQIFEFERDFAGSLRCIPMIVRFKLDYSGVKLTLRQWNQFNYTAREQLARRPCGTSGEITAYREFLVNLIESCTDEPVKMMSIEPDPEWACTDRVPERVIIQAVVRGLEAPDLLLWSALTPLQRFALCKLTRAGHDNDNFEPALCEFATARAGVYDNGNEYRLLVTSAHKGEV